MSRKTHLVFICALCICMCCTMLFGCSKQIIEQTNTYYKDNALLINEVMSSNSHYFRSQNGEFYDWVELYNNTDEDICLNGFYFSDSGSDPMRWQFPNVTVKARSYFTVYLSNLDIWDGMYEVHTNFKLSSLGESLILSDAEGNVLQQVDVPSIPQNTSYGRGENGKFLFYSVPSPNSVNEGGVATADKLSFPTYDIILNEYMSDNRYSFDDSQGIFYDWLELYNCSLNDIDLTGFYLTDDRYDIMKWTFPNGTTLKSDSYLTVFCSGLDTVSEAGEIHTNFSLSDNDDLLCLYTPQGILCSSIGICSLPENISTGFSEDGAQVLFARSTPGEANTTAFYSMTSVLSADINDGVFISETLSVSGSRASYANDWIEIYNSTDMTADLTGYGLSTTEGIVEFVFPEITLEPNSYLLVYCTGSEQAVAGKTLRTAFKLSSSGETLYLTNSFGTVIDVFSTGKQRNNTSSGRDESNPSERLFFSKPSPGKANNTSAAYTSYCFSPEFDLPAGYVEKGTVVNISVPDGCYVVVTKDGSSPDSSGTAHYEDFSVTIKKSTVLKAAAYGDGLGASDVITATYLVEDKHDIAVISLSSDPDGLFSHRRGIMEDGPGYTEKTPHYGANYWMDWERSTHIEYISVDGTKAVEFDCGIRTFGQYARGLPQKGLSLTLREQYGANEVSYPLFSDNSVASYKTLLLRPEGQDWNRAKMRDVLIPALLKNTFITSVDYMDFQPVALYINGEYWGLYYLREKLNDNYVSQKYGYEKGSIDLIKGQSRAQSGTTADYKALMKWLENHSLKGEKNYEYFCSQVDIDSFIQFWIVQTFAANFDTGNIRCYKAEDGKWRWMLYDFDWAFLETYVNRDLIYAHMIDPEGHGSGNNMSNLISRKLLENKDFRNEFVTEYIKALKYVLNYERTSEIVSSLQASIKSEIPRQSARWIYPSARFQQQQVNEILGFLEARPVAVKKHLKRRFDLTEKEFMAIWNSV